MNCLLRLAGNDVPEKMVNKELVRAISKAEHVVLATHVRPDGDALGSLLGFGEILRIMGKRVVCYLEEAVPELYEFLPGQDLIELDLDRVLAFTRDCEDVCIGICLDCGDMQRLGKSGPALRDIVPFAVIDHHQGNGGFGDLTWVEPHRSSTGEMVFDLALALGAKINKEAAECLYTAIVTDTGSFQYDCTSDHTFAVASELVTLGVQPAAIAQKIYDRSTFGRIELMQLVLATLEVFCAEQLAVIRVTSDMLDSTGTTLDDCEGFINFPRSVAGVKAAVFIKETSSTEGHISVSLRAKGECDVARIAAGFGGGGHRNAAGFLVSGKSPDQVRDMLLQVFSRTLNC